MCLKWGCSVDKVIARQAASVLGSNPGIPEVEALSYTAQEEAKKLSDQAFCDSYLKGLEGGDSDMERAQTLYFESGKVDMI